MAFSAYSVVCVPQPPLPNSPSLLASRPDTAPHFVDSAASPQVSSHHLSPRRRASARQCRRPSPGASRSAREVRVSLDHRRSAGQGCSRRSAPHKNLWSPPLLCWRRRSPQRTASETKTRRRRSNPRWAESPSLFQGVVVSNSHAICIAHTDGARHSQQKMLNLLLKIYHWSPSYKFYG